MKKKYLSINNIYLLILILILTWLIQLNLVSPDEAFTLRLVQHPINEIIKLDALDVHPPLYYILLKIFFSLTLINHCSAFIQIIMARIFSLSIFLLTLYILSKLLSNLLNKKISIKILLLTVLFPLTLYYITNIRMYSLAALFVACELIYIYKFNLQNNFSSAILLTLFAILSAWTHYFSAIIAGLLLLYNFIDSIIHKKKKNIICYFFSGIIFFISFLPWAYISLNQINNISGNYWIKNILFNYIGMFCYQRLGELININLATLFTISFMIICSFIIFKELKNIKNICFKKYYYMICIVMVSTIAIGLVISLVFRPIFVPRYVFPIFIIFISFNIPLFISFFKKSSYKIIKYIFSTLIGIGVLSNLTLGTYNIPKDYQIIKSVISLKHESNVIHVNNKDPQLLFSYYFSNKTIVTSNTDLKNTVQSNKLFDKVYPNIKFVKK